MGYHPGVDERRRRNGTVYRARVRRDGRTFVRTFKTLPAAVAWRAEALQAVLDGGAPAPPPPPPTPEQQTATVEDAARALCRGIRAGTVRSRNGTLFKPSVARKYETMLRLHVVPVIGGLPLATVRKRDVQRFVDDLAARSSADTARKALTALRVALRLAERDGLIDMSPCSGVRVPADLEEERPARSLTPRGGVGDHRGSRRRGRAARRPLAGGAVPRAGVRDRAALGRAVGTPVGT